MIRLSLSLKATEIVSVWALYGFCGVLLLGAAATLHAQQTTENLEKLARNPVGDAVKIPFAESINFDSGPYGRTSNSLQVQPTIPFPIAEEWLLIPRIVATLAAYEPETSQASGGSTGLGDTVATVFLTPAHTGMVVWGVGPSLLIPTATDTNTGLGKWGLGPSLAFVVQPNWGSIATAVQNIWSLPGNSHRTPVNQLQIETSLSYNLPHAWYLLTAPTFTGDWTQSSGERWVVPFGGGVGRTSELGKKAVDWNIALYSNAIRPVGQLYPKWQMSLQWTLLYPRGS
jgi:Putative MetA-pathway of phenol degradation